MNQSLTGTRTGRQVYRRLLDLKNRSKKPVYVLASHSHFYLENTFNTEFWRVHGGVLPGSIVGTAGAERYKLPDGVKPGPGAKAQAYGYLLATVSDSKSDPIRFEFQELKQPDVPDDVVKRFGADFVEFCWNNNPPYER